MGNIVSDSQNQFTLETCSIDDSRVTIQECIFKKNIFTIRMIEESMSFLKKLEEKRVEKNEYVYYILSSIPHIDISWKEPGFATISNASVAPHRMLIKFDFSAKPDEGRYISFLFQGDGK